MTAPTVRFISPTEVAKIVRSALRESFPGVKFSVRTDKYSGGSSLRVSWTDGPTERQVRGVVGHFRGATFDGMTDMKHHHTSQLHTGDFEVEEVSYGNDFIFTTRRPSEEARAAIIERLSLLNPSKRIGADFIEQSIDRDEVFRVMVDSDDPADYRPLTSPFFSGAFRGHDVIDVTFHATAL